MNKCILTILFLLSVTTIKAQFANPNEKFSISANVSGSTNTDYDWQTRDGDKLEEGRMENGVDARINASWQVIGNRFISVTLSPFYAFNNDRTNIEKNDLGLNMPSEHHRYGGNLAVSANMLLFKKPFTITAMGNIDFSQYGYEQSSLMLFGTLSLIRNRTTYLGVGAMYLLGTAVKWPLYPVLIYTHKFDDKWSIQCMEVNYKLSYQASPTLKLSTGLEINVDKFYLRTDNVQLPHKAIVNQLSERGGLFADVNTSKTTTLGIGLGVEVPFYGNLRKTNHSYNYLKLHQHVKPFVELKAKYTLSKKSK